MPASPLHTPAHLGRYEILDEIGKGAMGVVYLAKDPLIGRLVALKTFRVGYSVKDQELEQFRARFRREAQSAGILSHPAIVTIHDVVEESEEGVAFIAMEYVRGTNLKVLLQRDAPLDLPWVAGVIEQVAGALDYAHSRGVVHRDVKPANIIITADNRVKITDFGIARIDSSNLTQEGQLLGTPNYMSPEQILGKDVDHRADIFSLGVVLYEMLTRHKPFQGDNLTVVSHRIVYDQFTPPAEHVRDLPPGVEAILSRALDKDPDRRYQKAADLAEDLRRLAAARSSGEALNETQNMMSSTLAGALPAPGAAAASAPAEATPLTSARPARRPALPPWSRAATVAWVTAALAVLAATIAWLAVDWRQGGERPEPLEVAGRAAAPVLPGVRRELADERAAAARRQQVDGLLAGARQALDRGQYDLAAADARSALLLDPANAGAQAVLAALPKPRELAPPAAPAAGKPAAPRPQRLARAPAASPVPLLSLPVRTPAIVPVPADAKLDVHLRTDISAGILMVFVNEKEAMRDEFDFSKKKGFFGRQPGRGDVDETLTVPAGMVAIRVYLTPEGKPARVRDLSGSFSGGASRRLNIHLDRDANLTARLE